MDCWLTGSWADPRICTTFGWCQTDPSGILLRRRMKELSARWLKTNKCWQISTLGPQPSDTLTSLGAWIDPEDLTRLHANTIEDLTYPVALPREGRFVIRARLIGHNYVAARTGIHADRKGRFILEELPEGWESWLTLVDCVPGTRPGG